MSGILSFALIWGTADASTWGRVTPSFDEGGRKTRLQTFREGSGSLRKRENSPMKSVWLNPSRNSLIGNAWFLPKAPSGLNSTLPKQT